MIILGDAGFNYYGEKRDRYVKKAVSDLPITIFSIHGNHEKRPGTISTYHIAEWHGGQVYVEKAYPNLLFGIEDKEFRDYERDIRRLYGVLFPKFEKILILGNKNDKIRVR